MHARQTRSAWPFAPSDYPEKWYMTKIRRRARNDIFWEVGYIYRGQHQRNLKNVGYGPCFYMARNEKNYWWCRDGDWIPLWGEATQRRAILIQEIRTFWRNKWYSDIKKALINTTSLPKDVIELSVEYLEYPYEIKSD